MDAETSLPVSDQEGPYRKNDLIFIGETPSKSVKKHENRWSFPIAILLEHLVHDSYLDRLVGENVRCEFVNRIVLRGAIGLEEIVDHVDCALVVLDHSDEKQT